jgi:tetratricopeptide (TPR) repeat protein
MKLILIVLFFYGLIPTMTAQDAAVLTKEGNELEASMNENGALEKFKSVLRINPVNVYALNKCSELCSRIGKREVNLQKREDFYKAAITYAEIALKVAPTNSEANCVMAIALGRITMNKSGKEKIHTAKEIKKYVDISIKYDANNFKAWHVLGRWHYELSCLNVVEKTAVKVFFGGVPACSFKESIKAFEKSQSLAGGFILNYFEMAKSLKKNNEKDKALMALYTLINLPNHTEDDESIKADARLLINQWKK